ncbi:hypothetical protein [Roseivirga sp. UBA1976]|uniref:hypothetical protein n=1 Tax=Roseivirga sp. UBA1976 TaxID=1947386 RepID=UPI002580A84D|nr:hypothetical protein [Roseivirga sp. UBA1976]|tara:strand:- start:161 stop:547 length:387 start_codon:yes stop_codon:yes gene_type:complete
MNLDRTFAQINTILNNVWNGVYATQTQLNNVTGEDIVFTNVVTLDKNYTSSKVIDAPLAYADVANPELVNKKRRSRVDYLTADGVNIPTFPAGWIVRLNNYNNTNGAKNRVFMEWNGETVILQVINLG